MSAGPVRSPGGAAGEASATIPPPRIRRIGTPVERDTTFPQSVQRLLAALLAVGVALAAMLSLTVGPATASTGTDSVVLAVNGAELLGPDPVARDAEENPARDLGGYEDREVPFTWGAAWLLTFLGLGGLATMGLVYWRAVDRPGRSKAPVRR